MESLTARFRSEVFLPYLDLLKSRYRFHPQFAYAKRIWEEKLSTDILVRGPYLEKSQIYAQGDPLSSLPLNERTRDSVQRRLAGRNLYRHQTDALQLALGGKNVVVATGTSSGKTLCYQIPILDDLIRDSSPGLRAIIIYPLNALVNDQLMEWEELLKDYHDIRFARFSGQTPDNQVDYTNRLEDTLRRRLESEKHGQQELQREVARQLRETLKRDQETIPNRLNHRDAIRQSPPHILVTNFSMLEYLLERPVDAPIFENARLKYLVLDEVHAYRGVQATEIGFLIRRLRDRLKVNELRCIATSATLGKKGDPQSIKKVRDFANALFGDKFDEPNPIYGTAAEPVIEKPSVNPPPSAYIQAAEAIRAKQDAAHQLGMPQGTLLSEVLAHDENLYRLRKEILISPKPLLEVAQALWPNDPKASDGLHALLEVAASARPDETTEDFLPTRLHYFIRAEDGLHVCLNPRCPGRREGKPAYFVTRNHLPEAPTGDCPDCFKAGTPSKLVELVSCRKCGYQFGALQDLGPRRARNQEAGVDEPKPCFDSFTTELGWAADSFWTYFSVADELPYPAQPKIDDAEEEEDEEDLLLNPADISWCFSCGKRRYGDDGDDCGCERPNLRTIQIFHRQCPHYKRAKDQVTLYKQEKTSLSCCPNCGARNSGLEPLRRFQESDDEVGLAMAIPLAHFTVTPGGPLSKARKLLCFTDHRQRAAAFPSLLEDEIFGHDLGRKIVKVAGEQPSIGLEALGERLADFADPQSVDYDSAFFMPSSRRPETQLDRKGERDLWLSEVFAYFGIPDSARESAEDLGLVSVAYEVSKAELAKFQQALTPAILSESDAVAALQTLLTWMRQRKAFTLPKGRVAPDAPAFGRVTADISFVLRRAGIRNTQGWLPRMKNDGTYRDNYITDFLRRILKQPEKETLSIANAIWEFLTANDLLISHKDQWKLDHERIKISKAVARYTCTRCSITTTVSPQKCCPKKGCPGPLAPTPYDVKAESLISKWVAGAPEIRYSALRSEEHTAQINKDLAKAIEDDFRSSGVNLLSSTTTFEMGINIGDLQKVLLRNAPPSSASYIQRIGRAGRGKDKNAICVTMCRRTKYDSDAWSNPPLLMSGEVRTPTVFINNRIIAQRHFNAVAFAHYLRIKVAQEKILGETVKQKVRLESFLSPESRKNIPDAWMQVRQDVYLDFHSWLSEQDQPTLFTGPAGEGIVAAVAGFVSGKDAALANYRETTVKLAEELTTLFAERQRLIVAGSFTSDVERSIKELVASNVIDVLAREGFLPRYAFPLDVVTLETGSTRWSRDSDVELSRERGIAIAEFAPGAQVIARKRVFTSAGLYIVGASDQPTKLYFSRCRSCEQIRTASTQDRLKGNCSVCQKPITGQHIQTFVQPNAFSVEIDPKNESGQRYRRGTLVRQRQTVTQFIDAIEDSQFRDAGLFRIAMKVDGKLFRYNLGSQGQGFALCPSCGFSQPQINSRADKTHRRLRMFSQNRTCDKQVWRGISFGHEFQSYCLIARPLASPASVESLAYALQRGICKVLDVESYDIGVSWRWLGQKSSAPRAEIVLYDLTPGGAGFVEEAFNNWSDVIAASKAICEKCNCLAACYDCLKNYSNQAYHEKLNRVGSAEFLSRT